MQIPDMPDEQRHDFTNKLVSTTWRKIGSFFLGVATLIISAFWIYNDWKNDDFAYKQNVTTTLQKVANALEIMSLRQDLSENDIATIKSQVRDLEDAVYKKHR